MKHGFAFGEHIKTEKLKRHRYDENPQSSFQMRSVLLPIILIGATILLIIKLFLLQIVHGSDYRKLADSNRIRTAIIHAPRGIIFDRNGTPLVFNMPGFREVHQDPKNPGANTSTHLSKEDALTRIAAGDHRIEVDSLRQYPYKDATSHVLGYLGQISKDEIESGEFAGYQTSDWIGKSGIEGEYEHQLRGQDGKQLVEVDALGRIVRALGQTDPIPGEDITLTLDAKLQQAAYDASKDVKKGAIVVSRPDGEILAMVSKPSYDANLFTLDTTYKGASDSAYHSLASVLSDTNNQPLLNRAISGIYPPGSTFKLVVAASGLQDKVIDSNYHITDTGILKVGDFSFANWYYTEYGRTEQGDVNVTRAIARSNDIFFYKLAEKIGVDKLSAMATKFDLGEKLGIDLAGEEAGLVPTKEWKQKTLKEDWYLGDTYHYGIGQGYLLTTPLQVNSWTQVVANGGKLYQPRLLKSQQSFDSAQDKPRVKKQGIIDEKTTSLIRQGMIDACSTGGVAWPLFDFKVKNQALRSKIDGKDFLMPKTATGSATTQDVGISVACKTGTAQHGGEDTLPHAWITLFAPAYNPQVVVTVLVEASGEGSNVAAPIAKKILEAYFGK
ncbi:MAG TPA: penicillin-binding transpeptidase domain-containing protein [Methylomirabilota bacterium]|nr:penicillin-binding transpeptidase domain-containing protein [Methylomirabilota bacterium]